IASSHRRGVDGRRHLRLERRRAARPGGQSLWGAWLWAAGAYTTHWRRWVGHQRGLLRRALGLCAVLRGLGRILLILRARRRRCGWLLRLGFQLARGLIEHALDA